MKKILEKSPEKKGASKNKHSVCQRRDNLPAKGNAKHNQGNTDSDSNNKEFKYCIKDNGKITTIDKSGSLVDEEYKIDELIEEKKNKGFGYRKKQLVEFKNKRIYKTCVKFKKFKKKSGGESGRTKCCQNLHNFNFHRKPPILH